MKLKFNLPTSPSLKNDRPLSKVALNQANFNNGINSSLKKNNKQKSYVLYAVTNRDFINTQVFGIETYYEFFSNLKVLDKISRKRNIKIIVKLHPGVSYLSNQLKKQFNFLIFDNNHLEKLLKNAKFTISFSSTAIETPTKIASSILSEFVSVSIEQSPIFFIR